MCTCVLYTMVYEKKKTARKKFPLARPRYFAAPLAVPLPFRQPSLARPGNTETWHGHDLRRI